jgi:hypothetical protein
MMNRIFISVAIVVIALVLLAIFSPQLLLSPGKPIAAHEEFATDCFACHQPFLGSAADKCIECHKVSDIGIRTTRGLLIEQEKKNVTFHQKLIEDDCVACHSDHRGVKPFRPIGQFSHKLIEPPLQENCAECHSDPGDALHLKIKGNCGPCHNQESWFPANFDHAQYFRFDRHHDTECTTCHINNDYSDYTCYGCHEHSRSEIREEHLEEGIRDYENCSECHRSGDEEEAEHLWEHKRREGNGSGKDSRQSESNLDDDDDD